MINRIKYTGRASSIPGGIAMAAAVSMTTTVVLSAIIANFLNNEKLTWEQAGYWIMGMLYFASFAGTKFAVAVVKRQKFAISIMTGALNWGVLLCITALLFGGNFGAVWVTFGIIVAGSCSAAMLTFGQKKKFKRRRGRAPR